MNRDAFANFLKKSEFLAQEGLQPILKKLQKTMQKLLLDECDPRAASPQLIHTACFELSFLLIRHRRWHHASLLSELAIDFMNSEFFLPRALSTQIVESALDVLHSYTPREKDWQVDDYEEEFLEHLVVSALLSHDEGALSIDLGFGQNLLALLKNSLELSIRDENPDVFQFAPELAERLHRIMQRLFAEIEAEPWSMDIYRLKNLLQRDPTNSLSVLQLPRLEHLLNLLSAAWPEGATTEALSKQFPSEFADSDIRLLIRSGLLYEEPQRRPKAPLLRLSAKGYEMSSLRFAFQNWEKLGSDLHLDSLPSVYQATILQLITQKAKDRLGDLLAKEGQFLSPAALRIVAEHLSKGQDSSSLLDIFENLLHNRAHAWLRREICLALPLEDGRTLPLLDSLVQDDPSPMVRSAARAALQRQKKRMPVQTESKDI